VVMKRKYLLIEIGIVGLILIILCGVMLPKFVSSQRSGAPYRLVKNLQVLVDAIEAYQADHGGIPDNVFVITPGKIMINQTRYDLVQMRYPLEDIRVPYQFFYKSGYVDEIPNFSEYDEYLISKIQRSTGNFISQDIHIMGYSMQANNGLHEIKNIHIQFYYPLTDHEDLFYFSDMMVSTGKMITSTKYFDVNGLWMNPEIYFSPSNGLTSAGYVYVDSEGNHSPWQ
jgi:type II secretory pathway pseudopilin PulG